MKTQVVIRNTAPEDFAGIMDVTRSVYKGANLWRVDQLQSHRSQFPEGQFVAVDESGEVAGMAASLILRWSSYRFGANWQKLTDSGMFTNHDADQGQTLYGAELMVDPRLQGYGIGSKLCDARRQLARRLGLLCIRAGVPLRGYHEHRDEMSPNAYVEKVLRGELKDPALSFQLKNGFKVLAILGGYVPHDSESLGYAALIEWRNPEWSPYNVRATYAVRGSDYSFRTNLQHTRMPVHLPSASISSNRFSEATAMFGLPGLSSI